jgi:transcriptional regulator with XRE-family HTH domain
MNSKLLAARKRRYWTIAYVCDRTGVSDRAYRSWERGTHKPNITSLGLLCKLFEMTPEELGFHLEEERQESGLYLTHEQLATLQDFIEDIHMTTKQFDEKKRASLRDIAAILGIAAISPEPWERLIAAAQHEQPTALNEETISTFEALLKNCWQFSNSGDLAVAESLLPSFLPNLSRIAQYQPEAASLAARGLHLNSILTAHKLQLNDKIVLSEQSVNMARKSSDYNVLVTTLTELAVAHRYKQDHDNALKVCLENIHYCERATSPLVKARAYSEAALNFALNGRYKEATFYLEYAYEIFPQQPQEDSSFWYADAGPHTLILRDLLIKIETSQYRTVWDTVTASLQSQSIPERNRVEIINHLGRVAILENDLDKYVLCLEDGLSSALQLHSSKRFDEAYNILLQEAPAKWRKDARLKKIQEQFHL